MRLWMIVPEPTLRALERGRVLVADGRRAIRDFRPAYRWMADQMAMRLGPPPRRRAVPWWAWARWGGSRSGRPDLRCSAHLPRGTRGYRLTIEMPAEEVLLSDFDDWHFVLNGSYLTLDEAEWDAFWAEMDAAGHSAQWPYPEPFRTRAEATWQRIFDLDRTGRDPAWCGTSEDQGIQATFWQLHADCVLKAEMFTAR